jgi:pimeloyl-ACP methyl ester carboxylesterase
MTQPEALPSTPPLTTPPTTVVFLHGLGQRPDAWLEQVRALPDGWRARTPWLKGLKPTDHTPFDLDEAAAALVQAMELEGIRRFHLVGLSVGAAVALRVAAQRPEVVDHLVLASGQVTPPKMLLKLQLALMRRTSEAKFLAQGIPKSAAIAAVESLAKMNLAGDLKLVKAPTIVVHGARDSPNLGGAKALAAGIRGARLVTVPGGHALNEDAPSELNEAIYPFLARG